VIKIASESSKEVPGDTLMREIRCARHKQFSFDDFITFAVIRHRIQVADR